jgi:hypothetical protein
MQKKRDEHCLKLQLRSTLHEEKKTSEGKSESESESENEK